MRPQMLGTRVSTAVKRERVCKIALAGKKSLSRAGQTFRVLGKEMAAVTGRRPLEVTQRVLSLLSRIPRLQHELHITFAAEASCFVQVDLL